MAFLVLSLALGAAVAQPGPRPPRPDDPIERNLFPPELVMRFQNAIGLDAEQKRLLREEVGRAQVRFTDLKWELQDAAEMLAELLSAEHPDEGRVADQLDKVLDAERAIKQTQIRLMVRIKHVLSPEQQSRLAELRPAPGGVPPGGPPRPR